MNALDLLSSLVIGSFLITVVVRGNTKDLIDRAKEDKAFLKWAIAVGILYYMYSIPELKTTVGLIIFAAFIAFFMLNLNNIKSNASSIWTTLGT